VPGGIKVRGTVKWSRESWQRSSYWKEKRYSLRPGTISPCKQTAVSAAHVQQFGDIANKFPNVLVHPARFLRRPARHNPGYSQSTLAISLYVGLGKQDCHMTEFYRDALSGNDISCGGFRGTKLRKDDPRALLKKFAHLRGAGRIPGKLFG